MRHITTVQMTALCLAVVSIQAFSPCPKQHRFSSTARRALDVSAIENFYQSQPYVSAFLTCSFKASAADWVAQQQQQQQEQQQQDATTAYEDTDADNNNDDSIDVSRNLAFLLYGGLYQGLAQQFMWSNVFPDMFGYERTWQTVAMSVAFDMTVVGPFLCLPLAYLVKGVLEVGDITQGLHKYFEDIMTRSLLHKYWALWAPVQSLTFGVIPAHFRVVFVAAVSFFWVCILSSTAATTTTTTARLDDTKD